MDAIVRAVARVGSVHVLAPGHVLDDNYELVDRIGGGGMGVVFRARDRRLGRDVAVKVLKPGCEDDDHLRRLFEREARATAQLLHPNIVTLHHVGEHEGQPYLVLELLSGETLASRLTRRGRLALRDALAIIDGVLAALAFAHERGVLHRDLKPNNVFLTVDDRVKVLDFGVALTLDTDPGPATRSAGTPGYMAPEQRDGTTQGPRTDVWAAALLFVECVTGRRPDEAHALQALAATDVTSPLKRVLERALSANPAERPESAAQLRNELQRAGGKLVSNMRSQKWRDAVLSAAAELRFELQRVGAPQRTRRRQIAILVACIAVGIVAGGALVYFTRSPANTAAAPVTPVATPSNVSGTYWMSSGVLLFEVDAEGQAYGVYQRDDGILVGHYSEGLFMGRWCELPSRRSPDDAGRIEIRFATNANRRIQMEGRYSHGDAAAAWLTDWFGYTTPIAPPPGLAERLRARQPCASHR